MTDSIRIETGIKRILVNDDPARVIKFNSTDVVFAEKFYRLLQDFRGKHDSYRERARAIDDNSAVDENGIPANVGDGLALLREVCAYMREQIDILFGAGTSAAAFEDAMTLDMFEQFFEGIAPFIKDARSEKIRRYLNDKNAGRVME